MPIWLILLVLFLAVLLSVIPFLTQGEPERRNPETWREF